MPTPKEIEVLESLSRSLAHFKGQYLVPGGAENRRDQIKAFLSSAIDAAAALAAAYDDELTDPAYIQGDKEGICQSVDVAFFDAVEAEEKAEPRFNPVREWGTYNARAL